MDKYILELRGILGKPYEDFGEESKQSTSYLKHGYRFGQKETKKYKSSSRGSFEDDLTKTAKKILEEKGKNSGEKYSNVSNWQEKGYVLGIADRLMHLGVREGDIGAAYTGARLYEQVGFGNRDSVKRRLIKSLAKSKELHKNYFSYTSGVEEFLIRNPSKRSSSLEKVVLTSSIIALFIGAFLFSTKLTGNVIGVSAGKSSLFGLIFLVIGVALGYWIKFK